MSDYEEFLARKLVRTPEVGFTPTLPINPLLFPWQRDVVKWALQKGRAALFEECGLGKGPQCLEWGSHVEHRTGKPVLLLTPLAVAHQMVSESNKFNIPGVVKRRTMSDVLPSDRIVVTNYEMLDHFTADSFGGVILDESSCLKNYTGKTKRKILQMFERTPFKLCCTATPAPNDHLELGNHAEFLNIMPSNEMIMRWFINDSMAAGKYRLKRPAANDFWRWVSSWAVCISKPSDIGHDDDGFILPPLNIHRLVAGADHTRAWADGELLLNGTQSATGMWREKRHTAKARCQIAADLANGSDEFWVLWCDTNEESKLLTKMVNGAVEVEGSMSIAMKEERLRSFSEGKIRVIVTKAEIAGFGLNWQHCSHQVHASVDFSFERYYQTTRRLHRFGQRRPVESYLIVSDTEENIMRSLRTKQESFREMQTAMNRAMREHGLLQDPTRKLREYNPEQDMVLPEWLEGATR